MHPPYEQNLIEALQRGDTEAALVACEQMDRVNNPRRASVPGAALWYAERGLKVFPILPMSKLPYPKTHGFEDATTDAGRIREMFAACPGANIGIATGHVIDVIDFDGLEAHRAWGEQYGSWEAAGVKALATVSTPRPGGMHVYLPATGKGNRAGMLPGVDYRGLGGYVLAPPSVITTGTYDFLQPLSLDLR